MTLLLGALKFRYGVSALKFLFMLIFLFFFSRSLFIARSFECYIEAWYYINQLKVRLCNEFFKLKHLFLLSLHLVDKVKNLDELGSEHQVRTHINEPLCCFKEPNILNVCYSIVLGSFFEHFELA